jgi:thiamine-phosphate pyrophosphorylase
MADRCLLYYITDRSQFPGNETARRRALLDKITEAGACGVDYIQLRERDLTAKQLEILARDALAALADSSPLTPGRDSKPRFLINSRTDIALAAGAAGIHLRSLDISPAEVRRILEISSAKPATANQFLIAASCHTIADVSRAESEKVAFAVFAPVFGKRGALGIHPTGLDALRTACQAKIPIIALGGVTAENAALCLDAGAAGVAGIRLFQENKMEDVVDALRVL